MQISRLSAGPPGLAASDDSAALAAVLHAPAGEGGVGAQLSAYQSLAGRWRLGGPAERAALAPALTESPFAQRVQSTLNAFTRAAWAGADAAPPAPQAQILRAFDALSAEDQQIVAGMQVDARGKPAFASSGDYRAKLQADLDAAQSTTSAPRDTVTLSSEAQARLAAGSAPEPEAPASPATVRPDLAAAFAAYGKAAG